MRRILRRPAAAALTFVFLGLGAPADAGDCNQNGVDDIEDIGSGTSRDCNANAIPDECDVEGVAFEHGITYDTAGRPGKMAIADLDSDGDLDIATEGRELLLNRGDGTFDGPTMLIEEDSRFADSVEAVDLSGDGVLDLVSRNYDEGLVSILLGEGGAAFGAPIEISVGEKPWNIATGDLEGDGDTDIVVVADLGSTLVTLTNDGSASFTTTTLGLPDRSRGLALSDFDGDEFLDAAVAQFGSREDRGSTVAVLRGGSDGFGEPELYTVGSGPLRVVTADLDEDQDLDLVVLNLVSEDVSVLLNRGDGTFDSAVAYAVGREPEYIKVADVDLDGDLDAVTTGPHIDLDTPGTDADNVSVLLGRGDGSFGPAVTSAVEGNPFDLELVDLDGDQDPEIVTANQFSRTAMVLENLGGGVFSPPRYMPAVGGAVDVTTGDFDADGDADLVIGTTAKLLTVFENVSSQAVEIGCVSFRRGDINSDGRVSLSDMIMLRRWMFEGNSELDCWDSADVVDDDRIDICDVIEIVWILFDNAGWEQAMPPPFPEAGFDPTPLATPGSGHQCPDIYEAPEGHRPLPVGCLRYEVSPPEASADLLRVENVTGVPGEEVLIPVRLKPTVEVDAVQIVLEYDPEFLEIESESESLDFSGSFYEQFFNQTYTVRYNDNRSSSTFTYGDRPVSYLTAYPEDGVVVAGIVGHLIFPGFEIPPGDEVLVANIRATISSSAAPEAETELIPVGGVETPGAGPFGLRTEISYRGQARYLSTLPVVERGILAIVGDQSFFRGDSNGDDTLDVSDALFTLDGLFLGGSRSDCHDAADANDDGRLDVSDSIYTLAFLFLGGPPPPPPGEEQGMDPTPDALYCFRLR